MTITDLDNRITASSEPEQLKAFLARVESREAVIGIIGLGYVGLPLLLIYEDAGFGVVG